jgi:hypothetical protein
LLPLASPVTARLSHVASGEQIKRYFPDMLELLGVEKRFHALPRRKRMRQPGEREHTQTERTDEHAADADFHTDIPLHKALKRRYSVSLILAAALRQILVNHLYCDGALSNGRSHPLDRAMTHISHCEHARHTGLK